MSNEIVLDVEKDVERSPTDILDTPALLVLKE